MAAATKELTSTRWEESGTLHLPPKAGEDFYVGTLAGWKANEAVPVSADTAIKRVGVVVGYSGPKDAKTQIEISRVVGRVYGPFKNSADADLLADTDVGATVYGVDNQTLAKTNGSNTRPAVGTLHRVDAEGVWIRCQ